MAYDKVVDSAELDAGLGAVADAIREKNGESERLVFPGGFVSAIMGISTGGSLDSAVKGEVHDIAINTQLQATEQMLLFRNVFVAENYLKNGFTAFLIPSEPEAAYASKLHSIVQGNANLGSSNDPVYGYFVKGGFGTVAPNAIKKKIVEEMDSSTTRFRTDDTGTMFVYAASGNILSAGNYKLVLLCFDI